MKERMTCYSRHHCFRPTKRLTSFSWGIVILVLVQVLSGFVTCENVTSTEEPLEKVGVEISNNTATTEIVLGTPEGEDRESNATKLNKKGAGAGGVLGSYLAGLGSESLANNADKIRPPTPSITRRPRPPLNIGSTWNKNQNIYGNGNNNNNNNNLGGGIAGQGQLEGVGGAYTIRRRRPRTTQPPAQPPQYFPEDYYESPTQRPYKPQGPRFRPQRPQYQPQQGSQFQPQGPQFQPQGPQFQPQQGPQYQHQGQQFQPQRPQYQHQGQQFQPQRPQYQPQQGSQFQPQGPQFQPQGPQFQPQGGGEYRPPPGALANNPPPQTITNGGGYRPGAAFGIPPQLAPQSQAPLFAPPRQTAQTTIPPFKTEEQKLAYHYLQLLEEKEKQEQGVQPLASPPPPPPTTRAPLPTLIEIATTPDYYDYDPDYPDRVPTTTTTTTAPPTRIRRRRTTTLTPPQQPFQQQGHYQPVPQPQQPVHKPHLPSPQQQSPLHAPPPTAASQEPPSFVPPQQSPALPPPLTPAQFQALLLLKQHLQLQQQQQPTDIISPQNQQPLQQSAHVPPQQAPVHVPPPTPQPPPQQPANVPPPVPQQPAQVPPAVPLQPAQVQPAVPLQPTQVPPVVPLQTVHVPPTVPQQPAYVPPPVPQQPYYPPPQQQTGFIPQASQPGYVPPVSQQQQPFYPPPAALAPVPASNPGYEHINTFIPTTPSSVGFVTPTTPDINSPEYQQFLQQYKRQQQIKLIVELHRLRQMNATINSETTTEDPYEYVPRIFINPRIAPTRLTSTTDNPADAIQDLANLFGSLAVGNLAGVVDGSIKFAGTGVFHNLNSWAACQAMGRCGEEANVDPDYTVGLPIANKVRARPKTTKVPVVPHPPQHAYPDRKWTKTHATQINT